MSTLNDDELVERLKQKSEAAFRILIQRYQARLFRISLAMTRDTEESADIVQEVFLKVFEHIQMFRQTSKLSTWLYRITVNQCLNWKRRWKRRFRQFHRSLSETDGETEDGELTDNDTPENLYRQKEIQAIVNDCLGQLPEDIRAVLILKEIEGLSYDEIADTLQIQRGTVSSRLHYGRHRLRDLLQQRQEKERT